VFTDPDGVRHTVYISYRLRRQREGWMIVGVGSSDKPARGGRYAA